MKPECVHEVKTLEILHKKEMLSLKRNKKPMF